MKFNATIWSIDILKYYCGWSAKFKNSDVDFSLPFFKNCVRYFYNTCLEVVFYSPAWLRFSRNIWFCKQRKLEMFIIYNLNYFWHNFWLFNSLVLHINNLAKLRGQEIFHPLDCQTQGGATPCPPWNRRQCSQAPVWYWSKMICVLMDLFLGSNDRKKVGNFVKAFPDQEKVAKSVC